jgi:hypothetical protein
MICVAYILVVLVLAAYFFLSQRREEIPGTAYLIPCVNRQSDDGESVGYFCHHEKGNARQGRYNRYRRVGLRGKRAGFR